MFKHTSPSQFDLFQPISPPTRQRGGIPRHEPTPESMLLVNEMKAAGETQEAIARALGIGTSTLGTHYFPSDVPNPPAGRRRHAPTSETRGIVRRAIELGMMQVQVARLIRISVPTLQLYYRDELKR